ncbi:MAG TPA: hypothetical protein VMV49_13930 [Candidatus Deferrimicrobium sp.]|nr:hypothetical protein [Candidatus Deferrimicrobium sp.]
MLKLHHTENFDLSDTQKGMAIAILTDIHYYLDNGLTEDQIILVIRKLLSAIEDNDSCSLFDSVL